MDIKPSLLLVPTARAAGYARGYTKNLVIYKADLAVSVNDPEMDGKTDVGFPFTQVTVVPFA